MLAQSGEIIFAHVTAGGASGGAGKGSGRGGVSGVDRPDSAGPGEDLGARIMPQRVVVAILIRPGASSRDRGVRHGSVTTRSSRA